MRGTGIASVVMGFVAMAILAVGISCTPEGERRDFKTAPGLEEALNTVYKGIYDTPVILSNGLYEGEPFVEGGTARATVRLIQDLSGTGDLDCNGSEEAVVLLVENSGGSGSFVFIAVLSRGRNGVENTGTNALGDRIQIRSMKIDGKEIQLEVVQHGPADAACCPTEKARRTFSLQGGRLVENPAVIEGTISIEDLAGIEWLLDELGQDEPAPRDVQLTLFFEDRRISGSSGCNKYFAEITEITSGVVKIDGIGTTRMACEEGIMRIENRYLETLGGAAVYSFVAGRLALTCKVGDRLVTLIYKAEEPK